MRSLGLLTFMIPVGFSIACGILVGRSIGQGSVPALKMYYKVSMYLSLVCAFIQCTILLTFGSSIVSIFTSIEGITTHIQDAWLIFNLFVVFDTTQGVAASAMRASG